MKHASKYTRAVPILLTAASLVAASACARTKSQTYASEGETEVSVTAPGEVEVVPPQEPQSKDIIGGSLSSAITDEDALDVVRKAQADFDDCFAQEALNKDMKPAAYVFEVSIPANGIESPATLRHRTHPDKFALEHCVQETLDMVDFPAHAGETLVFDVRIQGGDSTAGAPIAEIISAESEAQSSQTVR
jgi:hypothetical protein